MSHPEYHHGIKVSESAIIDLRPRHKGPDTRPLTSEAAIRPIEILQRQASHDIRQYRQNRLRRDLHRRIEKEFVRQNRKSLLSRIKKSFTDLITKKLTIR